MTGPGTETEWILGAIVASVLGSLFAAGDEAATAIPEAVVQQLARDPKAPFARFLRHRARVLSRWLVCRITSIAIAAALLQEAADEAGIRRFGPLLAMLGALGVYGTLAELFGTLGRQRPERVAAIALVVLRPLEYLAAPLAEPLAWLGRGMARLFPKPRRDARTTETEVAWIVTQGERTGAIANEPAQIIRNALHFKKVLAGEVMIPRAKISAIDSSTPLARAREIVANDGHSRYPVFRESLDQIVGLLYAKDLFRAVRDDKFESGKLLDVVRSPALFVSETQPLATILREMKQKRQHLAIVADEFGGTAGVITLEDILEELVGDIRDEYDTEGLLDPIGDNRFVADASISIADLAAQLKRDIPVPDGDFESLGGLIVHRAGGVPPPGTTITIDGLNLTVREADEKRVVKVEVSTTKRATGASHPDASGPQAPVDSTKIEAQ
jgi:CBS domain containing-hemolysin-like protein